MNGQMYPRYVALNSCMAVLLTQELQNAVVTTKDMQRILLAGLELWRHHRREGIPPSTGGDAHITLGRSRRHWIGKRQAPYCGEPRRRDVETLQLQVRTPLCRWDQSVTALNI